MVPRDCRTATPQGWSRHYAFASIGHGIVLQRDCSLPHASEWVPGENLADPKTWNSSALQTLKQLHDNNCTEWAPSLADDAPATVAPAQGRDDDTARPSLLALALFPFLRLTFSLLRVFGRMRTRAKLLLHTSTPASIMLGTWDRINSCLHHASNWTCAHDHVLRELDRICHDSGFATTHKRVLTSEGNRHADLEIRNIRVTQQTNLLVDVTVRHDFIDAGHIGQTQLRPAPQPRKPRSQPRECLCRQNPQLSRHILPQPACGFLACVHGYQPHKHEFCHRRGVCFEQNRGTMGMACAHAAAMCVAPHRRASPRHLIDDVVYWYSIQ
jgi:hypothetical protein